MRKHFIRGTVRKQFIAVTTMVLALLVPGAAAATDYYVSAEGNDANPGTSPAAPWQTLARVNAIVLQPGDRVLLRGGDIFGGQLFFDQADAGSEAAPITVTSYGAGRATIQAAAVNDSSGIGILAYNTAGYYISNLNIAGAGQSASGILFFTDLPGGVKLAFIRIDSVNVAGFGQSGIEIGAFNGPTGYRDVRITGVAVHDNARAGIMTYAQQPYVHEGVYVGHSRAFNNPGIPGLAANSGHGIVLGGVNGGTIERSVAFGNGFLCDFEDGPVGIWTYDSTRVVIQYNESYSNRTAGGVDGGGFDLDQNVNFSIVQYNYSHDNEGAGYMLAHRFPTDFHQGNVIRYNISENDARKNSFGAIEVWGRTLNTEVHNNTIFLSPAPHGTPTAVRVWNGGIEAAQSAGLSFRNNILQTTGGVPLVIVTPEQVAGVRFDGNLYYSSGAPFTIAWGAASYNSLAAFRATGQETVGGNPAGFQADPLLTSPGGGGTINDATLLEQLHAYRLQEGSPAIDTGLPLEALFGIPTGPRDFFGVPVPQRAWWDIGAAEAPLPGAPTMAVDKTSLRFGAVSTGATFLAQTSAQIVRLTQSGSGTVTWTASSDQPWLTISPASGAGSANLVVGVSPTGGVPPGVSVTGTITLSLGGSANFVPPIQVVLNTYAPGTTAGPFGVVDTPLDHSTGVSGAVPFTGWALDDIEVAGVTVCREGVAGEPVGADGRCAGAAQVFIGDAVFIDGARPDVQAAFPTYPRNSRGGWGLMILTNMLPDVARGLPTGGNGTYVFYVYANDAEGHVALLGTRTLTADNENATLPFGTIDTPDQGEVVSGTIVNFGWVLTPQPKFIPFDGSTITVFIDGVAVGNVSYNHFRPDIAGFFPGLANSDGAIGFHFIDTTTLANGVHTIAWGVTDSAGAAQGIGSRYFTVSNGVGAATSAAEVALSSGASSSTPSSDADFGSSSGVAVLDQDAVEAMPLEYTPIAARRGWDSDAVLQSYEVGDSGRALLRGEELDRFEVHLGDAAGGAYTGYLRAGDTLAPLPAGSHLDSATGVFTWHPGVGFVGTYDLVFVRSIDGHPAGRREVRVHLQAKGSGQADDRRSIRRR